MVCFYESHDCAMTYRKMVHVRCGTYFCLSKFKSLYYIKEDLFIVNSFMP